MKLIRFIQQGITKTGVVVDEKYYEISLGGEDYNEAFF